MVVVVVVVVVREEAWGMLDYLLLPVSANEVPKYFIFDIYVFIFCHRTSCKEKIMWFSPHVRINHNRQSRWSTSKKLVVAGRRNENDTTTKKSMRTQVNDLSPCWPTQVCITLERRFCSNKNSPPCAFLLLRQCHRWFRNGLEEKREPPTQQASKRVLFLHHNMVQKRETIVSYKTRRKSACACRTFYCCCCKHYAFTRYIFS